MDTAAPDSAAISVLADEDLRAILGRLPLADLLRAALSCPRWRRLVARLLPSSSLAGHFFQPVSLPPLIPIADKNRILYPVKFAPIDASSPRLSVDFAPEAAGMDMTDCHFGLILFEETPKSKGTVPRLLVADPALRRHMVLPAPPPMHYGGRGNYVGSGLLCRAHPTQLGFRVVCLIIDGNHPRAWVASVKDGECHWGTVALDREVVVDFDVWSLDTHCVHAAGSIYWHILSSDRLLAFHTVKLRFSYLLAPAVLADGRCKYRIGEMPNDGRLCIASMENETLQIWVAGQGKQSDNGWVMERKMDLRTVWDKITRNMIKRPAGIWLSDFEAGYTGKVFIKTWGYGRYSLNIMTGELKRLEPMMVRDDGGRTEVLEYGHPIYAYFLTCWPPAFLAAELVN